MVILVKENPPKDAIELVQAIADLYFVEGKTALDWLQRADFKALNHQSIEGVKPWQ